jgi:hypothetical protein
MQFVDLPNWLAAHAIRQDAYDLSGGSANDAYVLRSTPSGWEVFYSERGKQSGYTRFSDEGEACALFCDFIVADPTTRAK